MLILLFSLLDEYETFVLTLINGKSSLRYEVTAVLVNHEMWRDNESSVSTSAKALAASGLDSNREGFED